MNNNAIDVDIIIRDGECVYALNWDTGTPWNGSGCEQVYSFKGIYAVILNDPEEVDIYSTLREAIVETEQLHMIGPATVSIESSQLASDDIVPLLKPFEGLDGKSITIRVNGQLHVIEAA